MSDDNAEYDTWGGSNTDSREIDPYRTGLRHGILYAILLGLAAVGAWALIVRVVR